MDAPFLIGVSDRVISAVCSEVSEEDESFGKGLDIDVMDISGALRADAVAGVRFV